MRDAPVHWIGGGGEYGLTIRYSMIYASAQGTPQVVLLIIARGGDACVSVLCAPENGLPLSPGRPSR